MNSEITYRADNENPSERKRFIRRMFDSIVPTYDLLNRLLSFGTDERWRKDLIKKTQVRPGDRAIDLCCGTGDVSRLLHKAQAETVSLDFSSEMLKRGIEKEKLDSDKTVWGDACTLPFTTETFDAATIAFGIRNLPDMERFLDEVQRVLRPKGRLAILELVRPQNGVVRVFYFFYLKRILPIIGGILSGKPTAYRYLSGTIATFMSPSTIDALLKTHGFENVRHYPKTFGVATIMICRKEGT